MSSSTRKQSDKSRGQKTEQKNESETKASQEVRLVAPNPEQLAVSSQSSSNPLSTGEANEDDVKVDLPKIVESSSNDKLNEPTTDQSSSAGPTPPLGEEQLSADRRPNPNGSTQPNGICCTGEGDQSSQDASSLSEAPAPNPPNSENRGSVGIIGRIRSVFTRIGNVFSRRGPVGPMQD